jgi:hypothetical protein
VLRRPCELPHAVRCAARASGPCASWARPWPAPRELPARTVRCTRCAMMRPLRPAWSPAAGALRRPCQRRQTVRWARPWPTRCAGRANCPRASWARSWPGAERSSGHTPGRALRRPCAAQAVRCAGRALGTPLAGGECRARARCAGRASGARRCPGRPLAGPWPAVRCAGPCPAWSPAAGALRRPCQRRQTVRWARPWPTRCASWARSWPGAERSSGHTPGGALRSPCERPVRKLGTPLAGTARAARAHGALHQVRDDAPAPAGVEPSSRCAAQAVPAAPDGALGAPLANALRRPCELPARKLGTLLAGCGAQQRAHPRPCAAQAVRCAGRALRRPCAGHAPGRRGVPRPCALRRPCERRQAVPGQAPGRPLAGGALRRPLPGVEPSSRCAAQAVPAAPDGALGAPLANALRKLGTLLAGCGAQQRAHPRRCAAQPVRAARASGPCERPVRAARASCTPRCPGTLLAGCGAPRLWQPRAGQHPAPAGKGHARRFERVRGEGPWPGRCAGQAPAPGGFRLPGPARGPSSAARSG